jgi:hypothetical protein
MAQTVVAVPDNQLLYLRFCHEIFLDSPKTILSRLSKAQEN